MAISQPSDITFIEGEIGNIINWLISAEYISNAMYYIYINNSLDQTSPWQFGQNVVVNVDSQSVGIYEYRIEMLNGDEVIQDTVIVRVNPVLLDITHPGDIIYVVGSAGHVITWVVTTNLELNTSYSVFRDLVQVDNGSWTSGMPIVINVDALATGNYAFQIEAHNDGKLIVDTVIVSVTAEAEEPKIPGFPFWFVIVVSLSSLFYLSKRARKKIMHNKN